MTKVVFFEGVASGEDAARLLNEMNYYYYFKIKSFDIAADGLVVLVEYKSHHSLTQFMENYRETLGWNE